MLYQRHIDFNAEIASDNYIIIYQGMYCRLRSHQRELAQQISWAELAHLHVNRPWPIMNWSLALFVVSNDGSDMIDTCSW